MYHGSFIAKSLVPKCIQEGHLPANFSAPWKLPVLWVADRCWSEQRVNDLIANAQQLSLLRQEADLARGTLKILRELRTLQQTHPVDDLVHLVCFLEMDSTSAQTGLKEEDDVRPSLCGSPTAAPTEPPFNASLALPYSNTPPHNPSVHPPQSPSAAPTYQERTPSSPKRRIQGHEKSQKAPIEASNQTVNLQDLHQDESRFFYY